MSDDFDGLWLLVNVDAGGGMLQYKRQLPSTDKHTSVTIIESEYQRLRDKGFYFHMDSTDAASAVPFSRIVSIDVVTSAKLRAAESEAMMRAHGGGRLVVPR